MSLLQQLKMQQVQEKESDNKTHKVKLKQKRKKIRYLQKTK